MTDLSMRSADSSMPIIMYRKRKVAYSELFSSFFQILTFSALRVDLHLTKKI